MTKKFVNELQQQIKEITKSKQPAIFRKILEESQLYRKIDFEISPLLSNFPDVNIKMHCPNCKDNQTFTFSHKYIHNTTTDYLSHKTDKKIKPFGQPVYPTH